MTRHYIRESFPTNVKLEALGLSVPYSVKLDNVFIDGIVQCSKITHRNNRTFFFDVHASTIGDGFDYWKLRINDQRTLWDKHLLVECMFVQTSPIIFLCLNIDIT
jgi:hypothetical protein